MLGAHDVLVWLECNVRKPVEGSWFDLYLALPAKKTYCALRRQN